MLAASYWSLLEPALEMASGLGTYGEEGEWAFIPVAIGFTAGEAFLLYFMKGTPSKFFSLELDLFSDF